MKAKVKLGQAVHIVWLDSHSVGSTVWMIQDEAGEPVLPPIQALGFVVANTSERLVLAGHTGGGQVACVMAIPQGCIVRITKLTQVKRV